MEAAQGLLSLPAAGVATGTKMAGQASALADELLAAATVNRTNLTALVRTEVDLAITALGLVSVQKLAEAEAEAEELRTEVARLRSAAPKAAAPTAAARKSTAKKAAAPKSTAKKAAAPKSAAKKAAAPEAAAAKTAAAKTAAVKTAGTPSKATTVRRSAVTTRTTRVGT
jgi:histone H1/5